MRYGDPRGWITLCTTLIVLSLILWLILAAAASASRWGAYSARGDAAFAADVAKPDLAVSYYRADRTGPSPRETDRVNAGITPVIDVTTKNCPTARCGNTSSMLWSKIAAGRYDRYWTDWADQLHGLHRLVWFTLDAEPEVQLYHAHINTAQTPAQYVAAYRHLHHLFRLHAPNVRWLFWVGGYNKTKIPLFWPGAGAVDLISCDPYTWAYRPADDTPAAAWGKDVRWFRAQPWARGKPYAVTETGIDVDHFGDNAAALWWRRAPAAADRLGLRWYIAFDARQWQFSDQPAVAAAFREGVR